MGRGEADPGGFKKKRGGGGPDRPMDPPLPVMSSPCCLVTTMSGYSRIRDSSLIYELGLIPTILCGDNTFMDNIDKDRSREGMEIFNQ